MSWVSWYKKSAGIPSDISENLIRSTALKNGLVDIKVCAVMKNGQVEIGHPDKRKAGKVVTDVTHFVDSQ